MWITRGMFVPHIPPVTHTNPPPAHTTPGKVQGYSDSFSITGFFQKTRWETRIDPKIFTAGGTIDKIYFDANSEFKVGAPQIAELLREANVGFDYSLESLLQKDSLEMTDADRDSIREAVEQSDSERILITHGTDTMAETSRVLLGVEGKTVVLTGSMQPARLRVSDAIFNIGYAIAALQHLEHGIYIAINGRVFDPRHVHKNREQQRFEVD